MRQQEWADLEGENAFAVMGVVGGCLRRLARESGNPAMEGIDDRYRTEAMDGDYEHLMDVSHRYAFEHGFVACDKGGHDRERVEAGLLSRIMQSGRGYIEDTRET